MQYIPGQSHNNSGEGVNLLTKSLFLLFLWSPHRENSGKTVTSDFILSQGANIVCATSKQKKILRVKETHTTENA